MIVKNKNSEFRIQNSEFVSSLVWLALFYSRIKKSADYYILIILTYSERLFEKWYVVILIELLPPLIPPIYWGEIIKSSSLPFKRGGLGWGKKIFDTSIMTFKTSSDS
jgi:hypothetical protein